MPPFPHQPSLDSLPAPTSNPNAITKAVIPAAGFGTRLQPLTRAIPKELLPIGREPVLAHIAAELREAGITDALFIISARKPQIRAYFGDIYDPDPGDAVHLPPLRCHYLEQQEQRGSGDAVLCAEKWVGGDSFVVAFGDSIIESPQPAAPLKRLLAAHRAFGSSASALVEAIDPLQVSRYGVVAPLFSPDRPSSVPKVPKSDPFEIVDIVEKPSVEDAPSNLVVAARWVFSSAIFDALHSVGMDVRGELNIPDPVRKLLRTGHRACAAPLLLTGNEARRDIGSYESFFAQFVRAAMQDSECGLAIRAVAAEELARVVQGQPARTT